MPDQYLVCSVQCCANPFALSGLCCFVFFLLVSTHVVVCSKVLIVCIAFRYFGNLNLSAEICKSFRYPRGEVPICTIKMLST